MKPKNGKLNRPGRLLALAVLVKSLLVCCLFVAACTRQPPSLPRAAPAYTAWLERQSMLAQAEAIVAEVSQSSRLWMFSGAGAPVTALLREAPQWLDLACDAQAGQKALPRWTAELTHAAGLGFCGVYLGVLGEDQSVFLQKPSDSRQPAEARLAASLELEPLLGDEKDLARFISASEKAGLQLGATLLEGATSTGPDFFLQARKSTGHAGLYAMLEVPRADWESLPAADAEWQLQALTSETVRELAEKGQLPQNVARDAFAWGPAHGWAATGPVNGGDGVPRRWLYRFFARADQPVMLWTDPSGLAKKIFSAAIIQQNGLRGIALSGLRLSALFGLEAGSQGETAADKPGNADLEIVNALADQIHRNGGWALEADSLPDQYIEAVLKSACDFCREDYTSLLLACALKQRDATSLARLLGQWHKAGLPWLRTARGLGVWQDLDKTVLGALENGGQLISHLPGEAGGPIGLRQILPWLAEDGEAAGTSGLLAFFQAWRAGLPGLCFFAQEELQGLAPDQADGDRSGSKNGDSNLKNLARLFAARRASDLASGQLISIEQPGLAQLALTSSLPGGGFWLLAANFSPARSSMKLDLPAPCGAASDAATGLALNEKITEKGLKFSLALDGYEVRNVIFTGKNIN